MSPTMWKRYESVQNQMLLATLPTCGVMEHDLPDISLVNLVGPTYRAQVAAKLLKREN